MRRAALFCITALALTGCVNSQTHEARPVSEISVADLRYADGEVLPVHLGEVSDGCPPWPSSPVGAESDPILEEDRREWYGRHLVAAGEEPLPNYERGADVVRQLRFVWLRTFDRPIVTRLTKRADGEWNLQATRLSGQGGYGEGAVESEVVRTLSQAESMRLESLLLSRAIFANSFEDCTAQVDENGNEVIIVRADGARWIVEELDEDSYRFVDRHSPEDGSVRAFGLFALELTGWDVEPVY